MASTGDKTAVLIGAGNLASHLGKALKAIGIKPLQVVSRKKENSEALSKNLGSEAISDIRDISTSANFYIIAVKDDAILSVVSSMPQVDGIVMHTSGNSPLQLLDKFKNRGVFYPLQTFSKSGPDIDFREIPVCIEANSPENLLAIKNMAMKLSGKVVETDSDKRKTLHLAAVFACNFTNHLYTIASGLLAEKNMDLSLLFPLISETVGKIKKIPPREAQTGPAIRNDKATMESHIKLLEGNNELVKIYNLLSNHIRKGS